MNPKETINGFPPGKNRPFSPYDYEMMLPYARSRTSHLHVQQTPPGSPGEPGAMPGGRTATPYPIPYTPARPNSRMGPGRVPGTPGAPAAPASRYNTALPPTLPGNSGAAPRTTLIPAPVVPGPAISPAPVTPGVGPAPTPAIPGAAGVPAYRTYSPITTVPDTAVTPAPAAPGTMVTPAPAAPGTMVTPAPAVPGTMATPAPAAPDTMPPPNSAGITNSRSMTPAPLPSELISPAMKRYGSTTTPPNNPEKINYNESTDKSNIIINNHISFNDEEDVLPNIKPVRSFQQINSSSKSFYNTTNNRELSSLRFLNASAGNLPVNVMINDALFADHLIFGDITPTNRIEDGFHDIKIIGTNGTRSVLYHKNIPFRGGHTITMVIIEGAKGMDLVPISATNCRNMDLNIGCLRIANMSHENSSFDIILSTGDLVFHDIRFKEASNYKQARSSDYEMYVAYASKSGRLQEIPVIAMGIYRPFTQLSEPLLSFKVNLIPKSSHTAFIIGNPWSAASLRIIVIED